MDFCRVFPQRDIIRDYFKVICPVKPEEIADNLRCRPVGAYAEYLNECSNGILSCDLLSESKNDRRQRMTKMFSDLVGIQYPPLVDRFVTEPSGADYFLGSCLGAAKNENGHKYFDTTQMIRGVGALASDAQSLLPMTETPWARKQLLGAERGVLRREWARAVWWSGDSSNAKDLVSLFDREEIDTEQGSHGRMMALAVLAQWKSDKAIASCMDNLAKLSKEELNVCALYLAEVNHKPAALELLQYTNRLSQMGVQALGMLGGEQAEQFLRKKRGGYGLFSWVDIALINVGDDAVWERVTSYYDKQPRGPHAGNILPLVYLRGKAMERALVYLQKKTRSWSDNRDTYRAVIALRLHMGDASAESRAIQLLLRGNQYVRRKMIAMLGRRFGFASIDGWSGFAVAKSRVVMNALFSASEKEREQLIAEDMAISALNIRAALRGQQLKTTQ